MAIFGTKKDTKKAEAPKAEAKKTEAKAPVAKVAAPKAAKSSASSAAFLERGLVLVRPRITEKAANMTASNVYTFDVRADATKKDVKALVKAIYKVTPVKVNMVNTPPQRVKMRKKRGFGKTAASRKAYVFLKKGESITIA